MGENNIHSPKPIYVIENRENTYIDIEQELLESAEDPYSTFRMVLIENCRNVHIIVPLKLAKILLYNCKDSIVDSFCAFIGNFEVMKCKNIKLNYYLQIPIVWIENSKDVKVNQHSEKDNFYMIINTWDVVVNHKGRGYVIPLNMFRPMTLATISKEGMNHYFTEPSFPNELPMVVVGDFSI